MKTSSFCELDLRVDEEGRVYLFASSPQDGEIQVDLSKEELLIFLTDCSNAMYSAECRKTEKRIEWELERERRRAG